MDNALIEVCGGTKALVGDYFDERSFSSDDGWLTFRKSFSSQIWIIFFEILILHKSNPQSVVGLKIFTISCSWMRQLFCVSSGQKKRW